MTFEKSIRRREFGAPIAHDRGSECVSVGTSSNEWRLHRMLRPILIRAALVLSLAATAGLGQSPGDSLIDATKNWLKNVSTGARAELLASTDDRFIATTPAGDVLVRERLIPIDTSEPVQPLPVMELDAPLARVIGETGIVISRLKPSAGPPLNATFVFVRQQSAWKLAAMHLSPVGR